MMKMLDNYLKEHVIALYKHDWYTCRCVREDLADFGIDSLEFRRLVDDILEQKVTIKELYGINSIEEMYERGMIKELKRSPSLEELLDRDFDE
jgi:hypothetical protein